MMTIEEKREKVRLRNIKWRTENPTGYLQAAAKYRSKNKPKIKEYKLKTKYGISSKKYNEMFEQQNGRCDICGGIEIAIHFTSKNIQSLAVDHCHTTGKVRGLLCQDCNRGIGKFHDSIARLQNAILYLHKHESN